VTELPLVAGDPPPAWLVELRLERAGIEMRYQRHEVRAFGVSVALLDQWVAQGVVDRVQIGFERFVYDGEQIAVQANWRGRHPKLANWYEAQARRPITRAEVAERYSADPDEWVYKCRDSSGAIIYIGTTNSGLRRFRQHSDGAPWFREVAMIDVEHHPSRRAAEARERELITDLQPRHNIALKRSRKRAA
jgi:predicted GIY-YIG superfamily endonuclease